MGKIPLKYWEVQATVAEIGQVVSSDVDRNEKTENPKDHGEKRTVCRVTQMADTCSYSLED